MYIDTYLYVCLCILYIYIYIYIYVYIYGRRGVKYSAVQCFVCVCVCLCSSGRASSKGQDEITNAHLWILGVSSIDKGTCFHVPLT